MPGNQLRCNASTSLTAPVATRDADRTSAIDHLKGARGMLREIDAVANVAVKDLQVARKFYEGTLGLEPVGTEGNELVSYRSGKTRLNVYRSQEAGTNKATAVTWAVGKDLKAIVQALKAKGVTFEHYDMPGLSLDGDIHVGYGMQVAWFKDPDGNILNLVSR
jgi:catechol 2,3-dioxygenase-like lactoylglutathione lyase family enzyme